VGCELTKLSYAVPLLLIHAEPQEDGRDGPVQEARKVLVQEFASMDAAGGAPVFSI